MSRSRELALTGALLCATAAVFGVPALYAPGLAGLAAVVLARLWVSFSARAAEPSLSCAAQTAEEGERVEVRVTVPRGLLPLPGGTLMTWPGAQELALPVGRRGVELVGHARLARRGRHLVGPARVRVSDPFDLCTRERISGTCELLVLPRVHTLGAAALAFLDGAGRASAEPPQELDSLRAHRPGSPASRIHWPTVARSGVLMEHSLRPEDDARAMIELDAADPASGEALDQAVRAVASLCVHLARRGGCLILLPDEPRPAMLGADLAGWAVIHARLALIGPGGPTRRVRTPRRGLSLIRVTASAAGEPAGAGPHLRLGPTPVGGSPTLFELAGCSAQYMDGRRHRRAA